MNMLDEMKFNYEFKKVTRYKIFGVMQLIATWVILIKLNLPIKILGVNFIILILCWIKKMKCK